MKPFGVRRLFRFPSRSATDVQADVAEEFQFHLDMRVSDLMQAGRTETEARAQALREFGDATQALRDGAENGNTVERRRVLERFVSELRQDIIYGWRLILGSPGFSTVAILTLAVAIGGNTAIFSVVNALVLKPADLADPSTLGRIYPGESQMAWANYQDIKARTGAFADVAAYSGAALTLSTNEGAVRLIGEAVSTNYFTVLGVAAATGRTVVPSDERATLVVLSNRAWRTRFASDPSIVGRSLMLDGRAFEVLGVMPATFHGLAPAGLAYDFWIPIEPTNTSQRFTDRLATRFLIVGRLKPGVSRTQATAELQVIARQIRSEHPEMPESFNATTVDPVDGFARFRGLSGALMPVLAFIALMTVVAGFVLLIGCANIAGLLLGRAAARRREIAVRLALGAGRGRLVRQLLTESLMLAVIGGALGVVLAQWLASTLNLAVARLPFPLEFDLSLDRRVLAYALGLSAFTAVVFGLAPARRAARLDLVPALKDDGGDVRRQRMRRVLVIGQVAVCTVLLVWGGLFSRSLSRVGNVYPGFDTTGVLLADIEPGRSFDTPDQREAFYYELQTRVESAPGIESAGMAWSVPLALMSRASYGVFTDDDEPHGGGRRVMSNSLTPGWFATVKIPLLAGRDFAHTDRIETPPVAIVNQTLARQFWNGDAIGRRLKVPGPGDTWEAVEVIGVVGDSKYWTLGETIQPTVYRAARQEALGGLVLHVRTANLQAAATTIRNEVRRLAPTVPIEIKTMSDAVAVAVMPARVGAMFTGGFGIVAMLLATLGVYGLVSFSVVQRTKEIGVRKAIGARDLQIVRLVVGGSAVLVGIGLTIGLGLGVLGGRALGGFIVDVPPFDPITLGAVVMLVLSAAVAASAIPAMRAARVDPLVALRNE